MEYIRSFISIPVPRLRGIEDLQEELRGIKGLGVPRDIHITIRFLGDIRGSSVERIIEEMNELRYERFDVVLKGVGAFPNARDPRAVWIGAEIGEPFSDIMSDLTEILDSLNIDYDRKAFRPHITMARVRNGSKEMTGFLEKHRDLYIGEFSCPSVKLMKSVLAPKSAVHSVLYSMELS